MDKRLIIKILIAFRDFRSRELYSILKEYIKGDVIDIGGSDFYLTMKKRNIICNTWTTIEPDKKRFFELNNIKDEKFKAIEADGTNLGNAVKNNRYDTLLNIQVLEHVYSPKEMVVECSRVLKPGGHGIFLIPQTGDVHMVPHMYCNFTIFWIKNVMKENGLDIIKIIPMGGVFSTIASRLFFFFLHAFKIEGYSYPEAKRNFAFYLMLPFMIIYAIINIPILMIFSLGDLSEECNNHLVITRKVS